jgi:DNA-binding transcriptional regulator GbsR (MarR family)
MTAASIPRAMRQLVDFLGELGSRWGLPTDACRVHGYLYLLARPVPEIDIRNAVGLDESVVGSSLAWLADYRLVQRVDPSTWRTDSDPWDLMIRALEERQRREVAPALDVLRDCHRAMLAESGHDRVVATQIGKLRALVEDLAAIDMQARRLPPKALRQMVGMGAFAARLLDRTFWQRDKQ